MAFQLPLLITFCHLRNLQDFLVWALPASAPRDKPAQHPCRAARCKTCPILLATNHLSNDMTGEQLKLRARASSKSSYVMYLTMHRRCGQQYEGERGQLLHCTINSHRYDITHSRTDESPVAEYFNNDIHSQVNMVVMLTD